MSGSGFEEGGEAGGFDAFAFEDMSGGFEDASGGGAGAYYYAPAGETGAVNNIDYIVDEAAANADAEAAPRQDGENVPGGRFVRFVRSGGTAVGAPVGGRSIFEELNAPIPDHVALPAPDAVTIFDVPLHFYRARPWDEPGVDRDQYFNYALDSRTFQQYASRQQRVRNELTHIVAARSSAAAAAAANPQMAAIAHAQFLHNQARAQSG